MKRGVERAVAVTLLIIICAGSYFLKVRLNETMARFDPDDPTAFYWTESALQYHYAELVANGGRIPDFDPMLQAPDGVYVKRNLTVFMEYLCGYAYRALGLNEKSYPFHRFTIRFIAAFSTLMVLGMFLFARSLGLSEIAAAFAGGLWAFSLAAVSRSVGGFLREDVSLPFFVIALAIFFGAVKGKRAFVWGCISGVFFALSLASWHFARFLFLTFALGAVLGLALFARDSQEKRAFARSLEGLLIPVFLSSLVVPVLFAKRFFISSAILVIAGAAVGFEIFDGRQARTKDKTFELSLPVAILIFAAGGGLIGFFLEHTFGDAEGFKHVWSLFLAKVRYLGIKPTEPDMLSYSARSLWIEAFNSPKFSAIMFHLFPLGLLSAWGFAQWLSRRDPQSRLVVLWGIMYGVLFLMVQRLRVIFLPLWVVWAVGVEFSPRVKRYGAWTLFLLLLVFQFHESLSLHSPTLYRKAVRTVFGSEKAPAVHNWQINDIQLARWARYETEKDDIFLSRFAAGPLVLAYANRPIALQPKFEVAGIKEKVRQFEQSYYSDEETFYELCQRWDIAYFVHDLMLALDSSDNSPRWVSGTALLPKSSVAFAFQFAPGKLEHFELAYQNSFYRVYRVLQPDETPSHKDFGPQPVFNIRFFNNQRLEGEVFNDWFTLRAMALMDQSVEATSTAQALLKVNPRRSLDMAMRAYKVYPGTPGLLAVLGASYALGGKLEEALDVCEMAVKANPYLPYAHYNLGFVLANMKRYGEARVHVNKALEINPHFKPAHGLLGQIEKLEQQQSP